MRATIQDVMTTNLVTCPSSATIADAARLMRDRNIGDVLVTDSDRLVGIVTDRDLVVRCLADGAGADATLDRACKNGELVSVNPDSGIDDAAKLMRDRSVRRLAVVNDGRAVGIVTLGDLAMKSDPKSALGKISAAQPTR